MTDHTDARPRSRVAVIMLGGLAVIALLAGAVAAAVLIVVPAAQETRNASPQPARETTAEPAVTSSGEGIVWESEMVADALRVASGDWAGHVTSVETVTALRRPVIIVTTDIGAEQADLSDQLSAGLASYAAGLTSADGVYYTFFIQILSAEGELIGSVSNTDERWRLDTGGAPADAASLGAWLDETFGARSPSAEPWAGRVLTVEDPATDADGFVVVTTDLDPASAADLRAAQMVIDAVNASGATFAPGVRVVFGEGAYEWSALLDGVDPYYRP